MGARYKTLILSVLGAIIVSYEACSPVAFTTSPSPTSASALPPGSTGTVTSIGQFQPAVASRDVSCLACHANIQANLITDFGYPDSWYMSGLQYPTFGRTHYVASTWQTIEEIQGQVIVTAAASVPQTYVQSLLQSGATAPSGDSSLATFLTLATMGDLSGIWFGYFNDPTPTNFSLTNSVTPPAGQPAIVSQPNVYIGAPTTQEILNLVKNSSPSPWVQAVGAHAPGLSGLTTAMGTNGQMYVVNSGNIQCSGVDVVINGTLLLNNANLFAETGGCRLYVTGSVFIEGPITYLNSGSNADPTDNLQITSATSIIMGVGLNGSVWGAGNSEGTGTQANNQASTTPLQNRLIGDNRGLVLREGTTATDYTTYANGILAEGTNIGSTLLVDAANATGLPTALSAAGQTRAVVDFQHILLNAPLIHSRYLGTVTGVIVAESMLFSLGQFSFNYDPVFQNVGVLPALNYDILCTSSTCNPANP